MIKKTRVELNEEAAERIRKLRAIAASELDLKLDLAVRTGPRATLSNEDAQLIVRAFMIGRQCTIPDMVEAVKDAYARGRASVCSGE